MRLYIPISSDEFDRLRELARVERRTPRDQAAFLLARSLELAQSSASLPDRPGVVPTSEHRAHEAAPVEVVAR